MHVSTTPVFFVSFLGSRHPNMPLKWQSEHPKQYNINKKTVKSIFGTFSPHPCVPRHPGWKSLVLFCTLSNQSRLSGRQSSETILSCLMMFVDSMIMTTSKSFITRKSCLVIYVVDTILSWKLIKWSVLFYIFFKYLFKTVEVQFWVLSKWNISI